MNLLFELMYFYDENFNSKLFPDTALSKPGEPRFYQGGFAPWLHPGYNSELLVDYTYTKPSVTVKLISANRGVARLLELGGGAKWGKTK